MWLSVDGRGRVKGDPLVQWLLYWNETGRTDPALLMVIYFFFFYMYTLQVPNYEMFLVILLKDFLINGATQCCFKQNWILKLWWHIPTLFFFFSTDHWTVLMASTTAVTCEDKIARCVELLLSRNADPNMADRWGATGERGRGGSKCLSDFQHGTYCHTPVDVGQIKTLLTWLEQG